MRFVDTNVLLYALSTAESERKKRDIALDILSGRDLVLSAQVLQEFYVQATRKTNSARLSADQAAKLIASFKRYPIVAITVDIVEAALGCSERFQISYWDAAILEAARSAHCPTVLSEDLGHNQDYAGVRVMNPFLSSP